MPRVRLIHWKAEEAASCVRAIEACGFHCVLDTVTPKILRGIAQEALSAVIIDLSRLPMQGRDVAASLRGAAATRQLPVIFADGAPDKVERVQSVFPGAVYCDWSEIGGALTKAVAAPLPEITQAPEGAMAAYAKAPLSQKFGLKPGLRVRLIDPPDSFEILDICPEVLLVSRGAADLVLWFVTSTTDLSDGLRRRAVRFPEKGLWILWRKGDAGPQPKLTPQSIRDAAQAFGLTDYKIVRVDQTWAGMLFGKRRSPAAIRT